MVQVLRMRALAKHASAEIVITAIVFQLLLAFATIGAFSRKAAKKVPKLLRNSLGLFQFCNLVFARSLMTYRTLRPMCPHSIYIGLKVPIYIYIYISIYIYIYIYLYLYLYIYISIYIGTTLRPKYMLFGYMEPWTLNSKPYRTLILMAPYNPLKKPYLVRGEVP